jgi:putative tryptophan/tyrosine transport system substrate-binding protein
MTVTIGRRELLAALGSAAAAWPLAARAQQPAMPVIGFLSSRSPGESAPHERAFRLGLKDSGYVESENVHIAFRWAEGENERLPALAADLVARRVAVILAVGGGPSVIAAKAATATIPIVFTFGGDPVQAGFVGSFNEPSGNITGVSWFGSNLAPKKLELLLQLVPDAAVVALLLNPNNAEVALQPSEFEQAVSTLGRQFHIVNAGSEVEIDSAFAALVERRVGALVEGSDPFLFSRRRQIIALAARHAIPTIHPNRESVADGGLMSYGNSLTEAYRRAGNYAARILKGAKPADLPVERLTKFELMINLKTARTLGLTVPDKLLALADEVIE